MLPTMVYDLQRYLLLARRFSIALFIIEFLRRSIHYRCIGLVVASNSYPNLRTLIVADLVFNNDEGRFGFVFGYYFVSDEVENLVVI